MTTTWLERVPLVRLQGLCHVLFVSKTLLHQPHPSHSFRSCCGDGISTIEDDDAIQEFAVCSLLFSFLWFGKRLKKPPALFLCYYFLPQFLALTSGLLNGHLDGTNPLHVLVLSLPAWFFASRPWKCWSMTCGMPFECFIFGVQALGFCRHGIFWNLWGWWPCWRVSLWSKSSHC